MLSGFKFRSLTHFESFCVYGVRKCFIISLLHIAVLFSQNHILKRLSLLQCIYSCLLCHKLTILYCSWVLKARIDHQCVYLFMALYSVPLISASVCLCWYHGVLITVALLHSLKSGSMIPPAFFFSLKFALAIQGFLRFYNSCPSSEATLGPSHLCPSQLSSPLGLCSPPSSVEVCRRAGRACADAQLRLS